MISLSTRLEFLSASTGAVRFAARITLFAPFAASLLAQGPASGLITGRVFLDTAGAAAGATVRAYRLDASQSASASEPLITRTDSAGVYSFRDLPAGTYLLCPWAFGTDLLNPCEWNRTRRAAVLRTGQTIGSFDLLIERGLRLEIDVKDPAGKLEKNEVRGNGVHLRAGVWGPDGFFRNFHEAQRDKQGRVLAIVVPFDTDLRLEVKGRKIDLDDDKGKAVKDTDPAIAVRQNRGNGNGPKRFTYAVRDVKP